MTHLSMISFLVNHTEVCIHYFRFYICQCLFIHCYDVATYKTYNLFISWKLLIMPVKSLLLKSSEKCIRHQRIAHHNKSIYPIRLKFGYPERSHFFICLVMKCPGEQLSYTQFCTSLFMPC